MAFTMEVVRLAKLAVALFGFDEAIVSNVVGQAEDILLTYSALSQLRDLLHKFEPASLRLSSRDKLQITEDWKNSFSELERRATDVRKICGNSSTEPLGIYHYDNVERQDEVSKGLNSIRGELQYHIRRLQEVIYDLDIRQSRSTDGQHDRPPDSRNDRPTDGQWDRSTDSQHDRPTDSQHDRPADNQWDKITDVENDEDACASCEDKEKQLDKSHEVIKDLEQKCCALEIDRFSLRPNDNRDYDEAETLYEELKNKWKQLGEEASQKDKLLSLNAAYVDMLIEQEDYLRAEEVTESMWEECKDEGTDDSRLIYRQYCKALRQQGPDKYGALVMLLRKTWPDSDQKHQSQPLWVLENGDELCSILELQENFERAYALRKGLWEERGEKQGKKHKDTVQTGIWAAQCKIKERTANEKEWTSSQKEAAYETAMEIFKKIWELWDPKVPSEADVGILTAGHLLGYLHYCRREHTHASRILEVVWEKRKALFIQSPEDTMLTGHYLSQAYFQLRDFSMAKSAFEEVWNAMKFVRRETSQNRVLNAYHLSIDCLENPSTTVSHQNSVPESWRSNLPSETLKAWFEIGWALLNQEKYRNAACILQEVYNAYRAAPQTERLYEERLICGRYLSEAIARQGGRCLEAKTIIKNILENRTLRGTNHEFEVLECRYLHGCLLKELAESTNSDQGLFHEAEEELKRVWRTRNTSGLERPRMLRAGRYLVSALVSLHKISDAQGVLSEVREFEEQGSEENSPESLAFCRSLGISLMGTKEFEMASKLFEKVWAARGGPPHSTGVLEDGYYLGFCRMKQQQNQKAKDLLKEVEKLIGDAEVGDWSPLKNAVHDTLAELLKGRRRSSGELKRQGYRP
jgi:tetratricopeptide (TPR) repeat protein